MSVPVRPVEVDKGRRALKDHLPSHVPSVCNLKYILDVTIHLRYVMAVGNIAWIRYIWKTLNQHLQ